MKSLIIAALVALSTVGFGQEYKFPYETELDRLPETITNGTCLIKAARIITITVGTLKDAEIYVVNGKIQAIGAHLKVPEGTLVIDASKEVVTPGIVDAHVHRGIDATNEGTDAITAEVRIADVIDPAKLNIWQAVASGETTALLLHGSANPVGGQSQVVKLKYRCPINEMPVPDAPRMIKFALGENVTRASSTDSTRFPNSRMGVEATYRRAFYEAREYINEWNRYEAAKAINPKITPPRRDIRLETLADILRGKIWVQCHSYRADEILMLARVSREFGFKIGAFQHALEAYKIAPELAKYGIGVSMFSDEWSFKLEGYDAIPAGPAICIKAGLIASVNTDGTGGTTAIIYDAGKLIREGGITENEALRTLTLNSAIELGVDRRVGSIEVGKDADLAFWDGHPFSTASKCTRTMIEGNFYFERRDKFGVGTSPEAKLDLTIPRDTKLMSLPPLGHKYALVGGEVHPMVGPNIANGVVLIENGKIARVGSGLSTSGYTIVNCRGKDVYPGMIDAGTALGMAEISPIPVSIDLLESGDFQADLVAATAVNRESAHFGPAYCHGILVAFNRPGGSLICGQASLMNTWGWSNDTMTLDAKAGLVIQMPSAGGGRRFGEAEAQEMCACFGPSLQELWDGDVFDPHEAMAAQFQPRPGQPGGQPPVDVDARTRDLMKYFDDTLKYMYNRKVHPDETKADTRYDAMIPYVSGEKPVVIRVRNRQSILNAITFAKKYKLKAILSGANEGWKILPEIKESGYPVILTVAGASTLGGNSPGSNYDPYDSPYAIPSLFKKAGIPFALQSEANADCFLLPQRAGMDTAYGLSSEDILRALTIDSATVLGYGDQLGSLEAGKRACVIITNGNPVETTTSVLGAFVDGRPIELTSKHTRLRDEYLKRLTPGERSVTGY